MFIQARVLRLETENQMLLYDLGPYFKVPLQDIRMKRCCAGV